MRGAGRKVTGTSQGDLTVMNEGSSISEDLLTCGSLCDRPRKYRGRAFVILCLVEVTSCCLLPALHRKWLIGHFVIDNLWFI